MYLFVVFQRDRERLGVQRVRSYVDLGTISISSIWANFFTQAKDLAIASVEMGLVSAADYEEEEPYLMLGVPALVSYRTVYRSLHMYPNEPGTFLMADGQILTDASRPKIIFAAQFYEKMKEVRSALQAASPSTPLEYSFLEFRILTGGRPSASKDDDSPNWTEGLTSSRKNQLVRVLVPLMQLAVMMSRAPAFLRRFREVFQSAAHASIPALEKSGPSDILARWNNYVQLHTERNASLTFIETT